MSKIKILTLLLPVLLLAQACVVSPFGGQPVVGGVLKSVDSGESWDKANRLSSEGEMKRVSVARIRIDFNDTKNLIFASPTSGVYRSKDSAQTWERILSGARIYDAVINPAEGTEIYAGGSVGGVAKVFKSTDFGDTWLEVFSESKTKTFVSALAFSSQSSQTILAGLSTGEIVRSDNSGTSWHLFADLDGRILKIKPVPQNSRLFYALSMKRGLYRSDDNGNSWQLITENLPSNIKSFRDFEMLASNPNAIYLATNNGLFRTVNGGQNWEKLTLPLHESSTVVGAVVVNQFNVDELLAAIGQTIYKSSDAGRTWQTRALKTSGVVRHLVIDPAEANVRYAALGQELR